MCVLILLDALVCVRLNVQVCEFFCVCDTSDCFCEDLLKNGVQTITTLFHSGQNKFACLVRTKNDFAFKNALSYFVSTSLFADIHLTSCP